MTIKRKNVTTVAEVHERVEAIRALADDAEAAHAEEDQLHAEVLFAIANLARIHGGAWAQEMASAARATYRIEFQRWCA